MAAYKVFNAERPRETGVNAASRSQARHNGLRAGKVEGMKKDLEKIADEFCTEFKPHMSGVEVTWGLVQC